MYKIEIKRPTYLVKDVRITPDSAVVSDFIGDVLNDLKYAEDKTDWEIVITHTDIKYLGEYVE